VSIRLTPSQKAAEKVLLARLKSRSDERAPLTTLTGYAGTGKTTLVGRVVRKLRAQKEQVYACAPTHKAAAVLSRSLPPGVPCLTVQSLLGLKLERDGEGEYHLVRDTKNGREPPERGVVVADEASMIGADLWPHVLEAAEDGLFGEGVRWLFVGDPAQLPPVGEDASPALQQEGASLEEVVRQAEANPIIRFATAIREDDDYLGLLEGPEALGYSAGEGHGIAPTSNAQAFTRSIVRAFEATPEGEVPRARVLAYRNRTVARYNALVRRALRGEDAAELEEGDILMARETHFADPSAGEGILLRSSAEYRVIGLKETSARAFSEAFSTWTLELEAADDPLEDPVEVVMLRAESRRRYDATLQRVAKEAREGIRSWIDFYEGKERFAALDYAYALTVHKSQGSTFETVFVDHRDLMACRGPERRALVYVAATRPSKRLALMV
jgi:exodeoxyribonuclease-5